MIVIVVVVVVIVVVIARSSSSSQPSATPTAKDERAPRSEPYGTDERALAQAVWWHGCCCDDRSILGMCVCRSSLLEETIALTEPRARSIDNDERSEFRIAHDAGRDPPHGTDHRSLWNTS